jgi:hypothetical protein
MNRANIHIYIQVIFRFFDSMSCFSFSQCITPSHAQYIYVFIYMYIYTLSVYGLIGRRPSTYEYMFIRSGSFTCYLFFLSYCAQYTICQTSRCTIHTYIYMYIQYFMMKRKGFLKNERKRLFDNLLFLFLFLSFPILACCQLIETYVLNVLIFRTIISRR